MKFSKPISLLIIALQFFATQLFAQKKPLEIAIVGLTHSHVGWVFNSDAANEEFVIVGIVEPNKEVAAKYAQQFGFSMELVFPTIEAMLLKKSPQAVTAFGNIYDHLQIVEICAPKGIHVMVEKPLAVSLAHAKKMETLAKKHNIHLLTNYETTWYPTTHKAFEIAKGDSIGPIRKVVVRDGHRGPKNIGVPPEFFSWLTDPVLNGGGAITDFGCYGANLLTWIMEGEKPVSITAVTQQQQAENNPKVDDEANIIVSYANAVGIIEASWNWTIGRKDMEIYGSKGIVYADNRYDLRVRMAEGYDGFQEQKAILKDREAPYHDPFVLFAAVINEEIKLKPFDLSSLENNMIAVAILDAAIKSAKSGKSVKIKY
jgi:predicted dehydrogenase